MNEEGDSLSNINEECKDEVESLHVMSKYKTNKQDDTIS